MTKFKVGDWVEIVKDINPNLIGIRGEINEILFIYVVNPEPMYKLKNRTGLWHKEALKKVKR